ncbi:DNA internalization-related competence protein ComEC/Rec2 [Roseateles sp. DAIF2]|uniref:DNA internalization-related competence protein ComEC/Rec2 n=1 Tax=Roseateles sp. DAIF2 TaxID=2714952 RepID=UPI0018A3020B|nr:DNA internalization-related competence protein ComEC/Rec2 [Roseateles sp. DAIF2]QPF73351.1 DNA internalization-related competence protein ComEC/Rec2 [Roseateles sp. DAIF2]
MAATPRPPMLVVSMLAAMAGIAVLQQLPELPSARVPLLCLLAALILCGLARRMQERFVWLPWLLAAALLGFGWAAWRAQLRLAEALPPAWEGRELWLTGRVDALPQPLLGQGGAPGWRFAFALEQVVDPQNPEGARPPMPARLLLSAYAQAGQVLPEWVPGERWRVLATLRRPHGQANPHGFDYELWLFEQDLRATGQLRRWTRLEEARGWNGLIDRWRQQLRRAIRQRIDDPGLAGVLVALSLGEQTAITRADWNLFRDTGTSHLMAISGVHITMFAWGAGLLVGRLWRFGAGSCLWLPAPLAARWAGVAAALLYALFSGFSVPAQRTVWMLLALALLRQAGLAWPWPLALLASAGAVLLLDPWALCQPGFWLSFAAVALLMAGGDAGRGFWPRLGAALRSQWIATLGLAPLTLVFFQQLSLVGLAANLLAIPLVSLLITPLALAGALLPELWSLAAWLLQGLLAYLRALAALPSAVWSVAVAPLWAQAAGLLGAVLLVLPLPWRLRLLAAPLLVPLLWPALPRPAPGQFELLAADVGQGSAVLLRTRRHALLYDAGPQYTPVSDAGQRVLLPLLRALGQRELDLLLLSHRDQDHVGGAAALLAGLPVRGLLSSLEPGHALLAGATPASTCERGQRWVWDGVAFEILHPRAADLARRGTSKPNALSCVLLVRAADGAGALLTGDIEAAQEQDLAPPPVDLLMAPHHGSKTSSSAPLLAAAAPRLVFVQAGYRNRFGHPAPAVLARYQAAGVPVLQSVACGALHWRSDTRAAACEREQRRRYWRDRPAPDLDGPAGPPEPDQGF